MAQSSDWLPRNHADLYTQAKLTTEYATENRERFGFAAEPPSWFDTDYVANFNVFSAAYLDWEDAANRTPIKTSALADAEELFKPTYRTLYGWLKGNPNITHEDLIAMGLPGRMDTTPTPTPVPSTYPDFTIDTSIIRRLKVDFRDHNSTRTAKPAGVIGAVVRWAMLETPPTTIEQLPNSELDTASPFVLDFSEADRGKRVYFCLAWENTKGEKGPWSEIVMAIIP